MATFVKLTNAFRQRTEWVNLDLVKAINRLPAVDDDYNGRAPERTELWFGGFGDDREAIDVSETPAEIHTLLDPVNACPEPERCSYVSHYLAYGPADLTHGGFHAAEALAEQHMASCRVTESGRQCSACTRHEERLRA